MSGHRRGARSLRHAVLRLHRPLLLKHLSLSAYYLGGWSDLLFICLEIQIIIAGRRIVLANLHVFAGFRYLGRHLFECFCCHERLFIFLWNPQVIHLNRGLVLLLALD